MDNIKSVLREQLKDEIAALPDDYISASDNGLLMLVSSMSEFLSAGNIMLYYSVEREPCTLEIANVALSMGKTVAFPYCYRAGVMCARIVTGHSDLKPAMLGIPAPPETADVIKPEALDMVIVPALTYDRSGYRLGYGGGYYDRYLCGIPAFTIGLARARLMKDELPREPHDIAVKRVVTESEVYAPPQQE